MKLTINLVLFFLLTSVHTFTPRPSSSFTSRLYYKDAKDSPQTQELDIPTTMPGEISQKSQHLVDTDHLKKFRPYPLFIAEKVAGVVDRAIYGLSKLMNKKESIQTKEHVVVLGSGWGAASFISELDPDLYEITLISPRNHFIFTPFLSGASVGSVEYRSICEPIREVRVLTQLPSTRLHHLNSQFTPHHCRLTQRLSIWKLLLLKLIRAKGL